MMQIMQSILTHQQILYINYVLEIFSSIFLNEKMKKHMETQQNVTKNNGSDTLYEESKISPNKTIHFL